MIIREAKRQDIPSIRTLWQEMMDHHGTLDGRFRFSPDAPREFERHITQTLRCREMRVLVAEADGRVVGYILGEVHDRKAIYPVGRYGFITDVCVTASFKRNGIGRTLYLELLAWFNRENVTAIELYAAERNLASTAFWRSMGFSDYLRLMRRELKPTK